MSSELENPLDLKEQKQKQEDQEVSKVQKVFHCLQTVWQHDLSQAGLSYSLISSSFEGFEITI